MEKVTYETKCNSFFKEEYEDLVKKNFNWNLRTLESGSTHIQ